MFGLFLLFEICFVCRNNNIMGLLQAEFKRAITRKKLAQKRSLLVVNEHPGSGPGQALSQFLAQLVPYKFGLQQSQ